MWATLPSPSSIRWLIAFFASSHDRQPRKMQFICWRLRKLNEATRVEWNYGNQPVCVVVEFFLFIFKRYFSHDSAFVCIHIFHVEATKQHPRRMNKKKEEQQRRGNDKSWADEIDISTHNILHCWHRRRLNDIPFIERLLQNERCTIRFEQRAATTRFHAAADDDNENAWIK